MSANCLTEFINKLMQQTAANPLKCSPYLVKISNGSSLPTFFFSSIFRAFGICERYLLKFASLQRYPPAFLLLFFIYSVSQLAARRNSSADQPYIFIKVVLLLHLTTHLESLYFSHLLLNFSKFTVSCQLTVYQKPSGFATEFNLVTEGSILAIMVQFQILAHIN